jgi:TonB-linked SusC/RagA family outer membrane protein
MRSVALALVLAVSAAHAQTAARIAVVGGDQSELLTRAARLQVTDVTLAEALDLLNRQSGVPIAFSRTVLPGDRRVTCACEAVSVGEALDSMLAGLPFIRTIQGRQVVVMPRPAILTPPDPVPVSVPQEPVVAGVVVDRRSTPLVGARVAVAGSPAQAVTDQQGRFRLTVPNVAEVTLRVTMIGYQPLTQTVRVGAPDLRLVLTEQALNLDELVVTGTPQQQVRRSLGNALGRVRVSDQEDLAPVASVQNLLSTGVPGVRVMSAGGDVGSGGNIRVRGAGSLAIRSEPLLYIDGVRVNNAGADAGGLGGSVGVDSRYAPSRINDLNPDDIETIEIIKGPAAATLYGTEASNGVINVITKRGRQGRPVVTLTAKHGANWYPDPENFFPHTFYRNAAGEIVEFSVLRSDRVTGEFPGDTISYGPWFRTGQPRGYAATLAGGTPELNYYFAGDWDRDEGAVPYNWKNRLSGRANLNFAPNEKFGVDFGLGYIRSKLQSAGAIQPVTVRILWACPAPGCEPGRNLPNGIDGPFRGYLVGPPETYERDVEGFEDVDRGTITATARHRPVSWFSHRFTVGADFTNQRLSELLRRSELVGASSPQGSKTVVVTRTAYASADYAATASFTLGSGLGIESAVGVQYYRKQQDAALAQGTIFPVRQLETVSSGSTLTGGESFFENKTFGAYVQQQLAWKNRVFLTGAIRGDDNSAFGQNFDFVVYPKLSASWVLSEEPFFTSVPVINSFKVRGAWGKAGQQPDVFAAVRTYAPGVGPGALPVLTPENVGNPDLQPEVGQEWEAGFDASFLDDRVAAEFTVYRKRTTDAIAQVPVRPSAGFPGFRFTNIGELANRGFEIGLNATAFQSEDVGVDVRFTYSRNTNEVVSIGTEPFLTLSTTFGQYHVPGFPLGGIFHRRVVSADLDTSGPQAMARNMMCESGAVVPGTNFSRGGGPPVPCAQAPAVYWGSALPVWEGAGAMTVTIRRNLRFFGQVDFVGGHRILSGDVRAAHMSFRNTRAIIERKDPILLAYDVLDTRRQPGIMNAGFAKLRDVSVSYTLPRRLAARFGADDLSITASGQNLWTIWVAQRSDFGHELVDPEIRNNAGVGAADPGGLSGYNQEGWPQLRRLLLTVRATF